MKTAKDTFERKNRRQEIRHVLNYRLPVYLSSAQEPQCVSLSGELVEISAHGFSFVTKANIGANAHLQFVVLGHKYSLHIAWCAPLPDRPAPRQTLCGARLDDQSIDLTQMFSTLVAA